jgi:hypothetical protein
MLGRHLLCFLDPHAEQLVMSGRSPVSYDVVVAIDGFAAKLPELPRLLAPLWLAWDASNLLSVDIYYRNRSDSALLVLHIDPRCVCRPLIHKISQACVQVGCQFVQLSELAPPQRATFHERYLTQYETRLEELPSARDAITLLAERLGMTNSSALAPSSTGPAPALEVRFQRAGRWHSGHVCRLSDSGLYVATGALPRRGDIIDAELYYDGQRISVHASVVQITSSQAAASIGAAGFGARFVLPERAAHAEVARFISRVGPALGRLGQPPRRREVRYPVCWPAWVMWGNARAQAQALDASHRGAFLTGDLPLRTGDQVHVMLFPQDDGSPIRARARVARTTPAGPEYSGIGVELISAVPQHVHRYRGVIEKVSRRVLRHVVVGSHGERMESLIESLGGAGYSTVGASDPRQVLALATTPTIADAVVIDSLLTQVHRRRTDLLKQKLLQKSVQLVDIGSSTPNHVREMVDAALVG